MTTTVPETPVAPITDHGEPGGPGDSLIHWVCTDCNPDRALCGTSVVGDTFTEDAVPAGGMECIVCMEMATCPKCGTGFA